MKNQLFMIVLLFSLESFASGNRVGNGGNIVNCPNKKQMLDLYESSEKIASFSKDLPYIEIIQSTLKNLARLNSKLSKQYEKRSAEFLKETDMRADVDLVAVSDSKHIFSPAQKDCKIQQIAIRKNVAGLGSRFIINKDLWDKLPELDRAALILHEIIYEHFYKLGEQDSVKARQVNAYLFSEKSRSDNKQVFKKLLQELKLPIYE